MNRSSSPNTKFLLKGLAILHEDRDILVVDKPSGLLTISTDAEKTRTAYFALTDYIRKGYDKSRKRLFIVHRLDRETSGILLFAKSMEAKVYLQENWEKTEKKYLAVVHGRCDKKSGTITAYLAENKAHFVYSTSDPAKGKLSITAYKVLKQTEDFTLLEINLLTGRKNQIRVHLSGIGHAVVGDKKYGKGGMAHARLALHAVSLSFQHPFNGRRLIIETKAPAYFSQLMGGINADGSL